MVIGTICGKPSSDNAANRLIPLQMEKSWIRLAQSEDADGISAVLRLAFASYERLYTTEAFEATTISPVQVRARMREGPVWVALLNDQPVGTASAIVSTKGCCVRGMAVVPSARGLRIGWRLLEHIERFARSRDLDRLYLSTTPFLGRAIALYRHFGFVRTDEGPFDLFGTPLFTMAKAIGRKAPPSEEGLTGQQSLKPRNQTKVARKIAEDQPGH